MSACLKTVDPDSFCATCLSQGRKMFPVKYTEPFSVTFKDLMLTERDRICWECNHFIFKMAAFRSKAIRAQASLTVFLNRHISKDGSSISWSTRLRSLSKLSNSTFMHLDITPPQDPIKTEPLFVNEVKLEIDSGPDASNVCHEDFDVFHHVTRAPDVRHNKVIDKKVERPNKVIDKKDESIANATLLTLLNRKSTGPSFPEAEIPIQTPPKPVPEKYSSKTEIPIQTLPKPVPEKHSSKTEELLNLKKSPEKVLQNPEQPKSRNVEVFTEEVLTEEEMLKWWESKRNAEFYLTSIPVFRCEKCVEPFCTRRSFLGHMKRHTATHGDLACYVCDLRFMTEAALADHKANHYSILKCAFCPHKWDNRNSMRLHCSAAHGAPVTAWSCELCAREYPSYYKLLCHTRSHAYLECEECGKRISRGHFKIHTLLHERGPERPFACEKCGRKFQHETFLKRHMQVHDTQIDEKAFCAECNKQFRNIYQYNNHMKYAAKHASAEDILKYICDECGWGFPHKATLRRHIECRHSDRRNYRCRTCPARFKSTQARKRHQREKHEGYVAPRDKMCDYCGKTFRSKPMLSDHINTHTGSRPYACELCGAAFGHKSALYLHRRFKHKVQKKTKDVKTDH